MQRKRLAIVVALFLTLMLSFQAKAQGPTHVVAAGENLFRIALQNNTTVEALAAANNISDPTHIFVGQVLIIPGTASSQPAANTTTDQNPAPVNNNPAPANNAPVYYTVQPGDSLANIARNYGVNIQDLITINGLTDPNHIVPGQQLTIPGVNAPTGTSATVPEQPISPPPVVIEPTNVPPAPQAAAPAASGPTSYVVQPGEGLAAIGRKFNIPWPSIAAYNNITDPNRINAGMTIQIPAANSTPPTTMETSMGVPPGPNPPATAGKYIKVVLREQRVYAFQDGVLLRNVLVSTGLPGTPTVQGDYRIYVKYTAQLMSGPGYYLPGVPWVMYFHQGYGLHGTYWHSNWGHPMSHGCVNMPTEEAQWLYSWAEVGTPVHVEW